MSADASRDLTTDFLRERPRLLRLAYATLGSWVEAEDVVQESWLRASTVDWSEIEEPAAWLTRVTARLSLDALRSARMRRERYVGTWLPEPRVTELGPSPAEAAVVAEEVELALLRVMEDMRPAERVAFVLHDVFGMGFDAVGETLNRSPEAARTLASRGRRRARAVGAGSDGPTDQTKHGEVVAAFAAAVASGELEQVLALLAPDVVLRSDGGGVVSAARHPLRGGDRVARALLAISRTRGAWSSTARVLVNGLPGLLIAFERERSVIAFAVDRSRITAIDIQRNPAKLPADLDRYLPAT